MFDPRRAPASPAAVAIAAIAAVAFAYAAPRAAAAQGPESAAARARTMTLREALEYARAHQPAIRAAIARVNARREEAKIPSAQWHPTVGVTAQLFGGTFNNTTGTYVTPPFMDIPRIGATRSTGSGSLRPYAATFVGVGITQEIFDFGRIAAERAAADAMIEVERHAAEGERLDMELDVEESYYAVFAAHGVLTAAEGAYERAKAHRDFARAGVEAGMRSPIELTRAEADLTRFDIGRVRAQGSLAVAESVLAASIGAPDMAVDARGEPPPLATMPTLAEAMQKASARDPRVQQALAELRAQEAKTRAIAAADRPDLSLSAGVNGRAGGAPPSSGDVPPGSGFLPAVPNYDAGLIFTWPIYDPAVTARADASRAREDVRRQELETFRFAQVAAIKQAYVAVEVARIALPGLARAFDAARANYAQADARFKAGMGTSIELADAEALRTDAEIQLAAGSFELARARAAFGRAIAEGL